MKTGYIMMVLALIWVGTNIILSGAIGHEVIQRQKESPGAPQAALGVSQDLLAWRQLVNKSGLDAEVSWSAANFTKTVWIILKALSGYQSLFETRGAVPGTYWSEILLGNNLEYQRYKLVGMPYNQREEVFRNTIGNLIETNPLAAIELVTYIDHPSSKTQSSYNFLSSVQYTMILMFCVIIIIRLGQWFAALI
jgi:hypothetical protein